MQKQSGKDRFKNYLRKIGSGRETGRSLTRKESGDALKLLINDIPTPAQIGAFLIAHRIKRPEAKELAGMLDTYKELGPKIKSNKKQKQPIFFGMPFDGRTRTSPIYPLTTLVLISAGQPVLLQGGSRMPVKYGVTTLELFQALNLDLKDLTIKKVQDGFIKNNFAFIYQPNHFSLADNLIRFREEIGKRPPIASLELIWCAHEGEHFHISGYVHPPTENRHQQTLKLIGEEKIITLKGLEGSTDIPISRISIINYLNNENQKNLHLNPSQYNMNGTDLNWSDINKWQKFALEVINGKGELMQSVVWNAGVYLWLIGINNTINEGIDHAKLLITSGSVKKTLEKLIHWRSNN